MYYVVVLCNLSLRTQDAKNLATAFDFMKNQERIPLYIGWWVLGLDCYLEWRWEMWQLLVCEG